MRDFIISTDSTVDLPESYLKENNILVQPLYYTIGGEEYISGISDIPSKDFYRRIKDGEEAGTSASNPRNIMESMRRKIEEGYDILHISFSSALSSSYNNALICAENLMEEIPNANIIVMDSLCATVGQGLLVWKAAEMKKAGKTMNEIIQYIEQNKNKIIHEFIVEDLFHLVRGGRLTQSTAFVGTMLRIQPVLHLDDEGKIASVGKIRGRKKALNFLADNIDAKVKGIDLEALFIGHADCVEDAEYLAERIKNRYSVNNIIINDICPTIGVHTGQGCVVVSYLGDKR